MTTLPVTGAEEAVEKVRRPALRWPIRKDLATRHDTSGDKFAIEIEGEVVRDRGIAGELILRRAEKLLGTTLERAIGRFAGFQLVVADVLMAGPQVLLRGEATHTAKVTDTALGTIRSVEHAIQSLGEVAASVEHSIADTKKRISDLTAQIGQPFEYEDKLTTQVRRQQEITGALDLSKNQASAQLPAESVSEMPVAEADGASRPHQPWPSPDLPRVDSHFDADLAAGRRGPNCARVSEAPGIS